MSSKYPVFNGARLPLRVRHMSRLQRQTLTVIETCRHMLRIPKKFRPEVGAATSTTVNEILARVHEARPNDKTLSNINIETARYNWWTLLYMMESVNRLLS